MTRWLQKFSSKMPTASTDILDRLPIVSSVSVLSIGITTQEMF